jgi:NAD(P)-dependent dehydrogenase (short-subunit alcohol dehydrogenase family)
MAVTHGALVVCGSGPGVARGIATLFAERGFEKVILLSRSAERLSKEAENVRSKSATTKVYEITADFGNAEQVKAGLARVEVALGETPLDCVLYNAARTGRSDILDFSPEDFQSDLQVRADPLPRRRE